MSEYILAIDQGTTSSRAFIFNSKGQIKGVGQKEFKQHYPHPGWVEHDPEEIWSSVVACIKEALKTSRINSRQIKAIGITNQRETSLMWDRATSKPVARAIVWQCRRTAEICQKLKKHEILFRQKTGLVMDPYFSGTKVRWLLDHVRGLRKRTQSNRICFGTIDSWLIWKLTGGESHVTDVTNASRTLMFDIKKLQWDASLLKILKVPRSVLPEVKNSGSIFGYTKRIAGLPSGIPIASVLGDQQAALYGQGCYEAGSVKNTYGTGCFMVLHTGNKVVRSRGGLLSTVVSDFKGRPCYALEGAVFIAGAVIQWLRDELEFFSDAKNTEKIIAGVKSSQGVYFVPAFVGLGAPYWDAQARGVICGLTRGSNRAHITRAALESMAYQVKDVFDLMQKEYGKKIKTLNVDGGACQNNFLMQFQADMLRSRIQRPKNIDTTVQGAAQLAGVVTGIFRHKKDLRSFQKKDKTFHPKMKIQESRRLYQGWQAAIKKTIT